MTERLTHGHRMRHRNIIKIHSNWGGKRHRLKERQIQTGRAQSQNISDQRNPEAGERKVRQVF